MNALDRTQATARLRGSFSRRIAPTLFVPLLAASTLAAVLFGCNPPEASDVTIRLKWLHQAQFAGFYYAKESGLYSSRGYNVDLHAGGTDYPAIQMVASGSDDFGVTGADQILIARSRGIPVVAIACIYRKSPFVLFSLSSSAIDSLTDIAGKRVGVKYGGNEELTYRAMLASVGYSKADVEEIPVKFDITPLLTKQVDVWPGYSINEPILAEEQGFSVTLLRPSDYGVDLYADVLFTTEETLRLRPQMVADIVAATLEGWRSAFEHPELAITYTLMQSDQLNHDHELKMLNASIDLVKPDSLPLGWMDTETWTSMDSLLHRQGLLDVPPDVSMAFRINFLPKSPN